MFWSIITKINLFLVHLFKVHQKHEKLKFHNMFNFITKISKSINVIKAKI